MVQRRPSKMGSIHVSGEVPTLGWAVRVSSKGGVGGYVPRIMDWSDHNISWKTGAWLFEAQVV